MATDDIITKSMFSLLISEKYRINRIIHKNNLVKQTLPKLYV